MEAQEIRRWWSARRGPVTGVAAVVAIGVTLVALTLRQPEVPAHAPTVTVPADVGDRLVGPVVHTVDATDADRWRYFSFRLGAVLDAPGPRDWDLAFRRFHVIANGGPGFRGEGGIRDLGAVPFDAVRTVPAEGYQRNTAGPDSTNPAIAGWYRYSYLSHLLTPKPHVWAVRTADGRYAKIEMVGYYCPGARPGCLTFRYVYQGDGSTALASEPALPHAALVRGQVSGIPGPLGIDPLELRVRRGGDARALAGLHAAARVGRLSRVARGGAAFPGTRRGAGRLDFRLRFLVAGGHVLRRRHLGRGHAGRQREDDRGEDRHSDQKPEHCFSPAISRISPPGDITVHAIRVPPASA